MGESWQDGGRGRKMKERRRKKGERRDIGKRASQPAERKENERKKQQKMCRRDPCAQTKNRTKKK